VNDVPTYAYKCENEECKHNDPKTPLDIFHSIMDEQKKKCTACGKNTLVRLISGGGGIIFKGSGWTKSIEYINDAARDNPSGEVGIN
jgi:putative FmdB family regulatory protein